METIKKITIEDKNYPQRLKEIDRPPKILYYQGKLKSEELCVAIVGTRRCSPYGKHMALEIAGDICTAGVTVVSGLAPGIDTFSHQAVVEKALSNGASQSMGRTIAVLGTGLREQDIYPKENIELARKIVQTGGCLISEYRPGTRGSKFSFPQRNRLIAGLSLGVVVIEAKQKSGALITAAHAFQQKRKVFALPGSVHWLNSKGCHYLIKKGARLIESAKDILEELNLSSLADLRADVKELKGQNREEDLLLEVLAQAPLDVDEIIEKTNLSASVVARALASLEISRKVRHLGGNMYGLWR